ncbi:MAG: phosphoenolpyruvate--protein phosphotransferase [Clostridium sp.]|nr:phosphoenolpyruvate--protein phosphotransferase [Clostridium sp.]
MEKVLGTIACKGIAIGKISLINHASDEIKVKKINDVDAEMKRLDEALEKSKAELQNLYEKAVKEVGEENAEIFSVHQMMLEDLDYYEAIEKLIREDKYNAEYSVTVTGKSFSETFANMDDDYMKERAADVKDISKRLVSVLMGKNQENIDSNESAIIVTDDLAPSETLQLDKNKILAFVTVHGSTNSHTAILARTMGIPALIGVNISLEDNLDGKTMVVDALEGVIYINPDEEILKKMQKKQCEENKNKDMLQALKGKENITLDGQKINIYANIGGVVDVDAVLQNDAGGIGLFRSEFLYLEKNDYPTEEEQFAVYKEVAQKMNGKKVIIRTCDIGADKQVDYFNIEHEENPALGYRAIRICLDRTDMFKTQLRAIFRASYYGNVAVMYPMIISVDEVKKIKALVEEVKKELDEENIKYGNVEQGIMIETPAAAIISDLLAKEVDFFSIGTNDLTQYTLAIDRQNPRLEKINDTHHVALLRMIKMVVDNAHKEGIWAGICGELGADITLTEEFLRMGLDEVSVSPASVLAVRNKVRNTKLK